MKREIIFLVGPTASGKSKTALYLAKKINAEIISCDSMQIYKKMAILTSQPPLKIQKQLVHYLVGVIPPGREYSVSKFSLSAKKKIKEIIKKGKFPLFVGGTGLYMSVLLDGIFRIKPPDEQIRLKLCNLAKKRGSLYLYHRLKQIDAEAALKIHPHDLRRIIRALEVFESTGKPISYLQKKRKGLIKEYKVRIFCLNLEREKLYARIDRRVEEMFRLGAIEEIKNLLRYKLSKTAAMAIGIREIKGYLDGAYGLEEAKRLIKHHTRLYAKRQLTWFRQDKRIEWVQIKDSESPAIIAKRIKQKIG